MLKFIGMLFVVFIIGCGNSNNDITCQHNTDCADSSYCVFQSYMPSKADTSPHGVCYTFQRPYGDEQCGPGETYIPIIYKQGSEVCSPTSQNNYYANACITANGIISGMKADFEVNTYLEEYINGYRCAFNESTITTIGYLSIQ